MILVRIQTVKTWPIDPLGLGLRMVQLEVSESESERASARESEREREREREREERQRERSVAKLDGVRWEEGGGLKRCLGARNC